MKRYLDTANVQEIQEAATLGIPDGVTTHPSRVAKEVRVFRETLIEICTIVDEPISTETISLVGTAMVKEGKELSKIHQNIVVKVPLISEGLKTTKRMMAERIKVNVTLCSSPTQALPAANAGAWHVPPYIGRFDNIDSKLNRVDPSDCDDRKTLRLQDLWSGGECPSPAGHGQGGLGRRRYLYHADRCVPRVHQAPMTDLDVNMFLAGWNAQFQKSPTVRKGIPL
jgi:transaldolase